MPAVNTLEAFGAFEYGLLLIFGVGTCAILLVVWLDHLIPPFPDYIGANPPYADGGSAYTDV